MTLDWPLLLAIVLALLAYWGVRLGVELGRFIAVVIFGVYLVGVANFTLLPLEYDPELARAVGPTYIDRLLELTPFFFPGGEPMSRDQLLLNILLTVPFGFGLPFVISIRLRNVVLVGVLFSIGIELAQSIADVTQLALPPWSIDINDVFLNTTGVIVGVALFLAASALYRAIARGLDPARLGPWRHFHATLLNRRSPAT
jgi:glycopeptide antibiotics resistance protein